MEIKFTDMDLVDVNICFSREYLTKARAVNDKERALKLLVLARQSVENAIKQIDSSLIINNKSPFPSKTKRN
jgi:hypothetical protein